jgi:hypothetical protein
MGRAKGRNAATATAATPRSRSAAATAAARSNVIDRLGFGALLGERPVTTAADKVVRSLSGRAFVENIEAWREQEHQFIEGARSELEAGMREFARSGQWGKFLRLYTLSPEYSPMNGLWARVQLRSKWAQLVHEGRAQADELGDPADGRFFSMSAAKALGARVRDDYFYRPTSEAFDDRYVVEMCKPLGFNGFFDERVVLDASGRPVMDPATGKPKIRKEFIKTTAKGYGTFQAYHTKALVDSEGNPFTLPPMPWANATGSDADATALITDLERVCVDEGLMLTRAALADGAVAAVDPKDPTASLPEHARYEREARTITVDDRQTQPEQAVALLRALCEHLGYDRAPRDETERKVRRAAAESAKYAIASLYGLAAEDQTFPYLLELADDEKAIGQVASDTHRRVQQVLAHLDPIMRVKARAEGERKQKARSAHGRGRKQASARAVVAA